ncbi:Guanosine-diphosphatase, partial [Lobulomyces angularis]
MKFNGKNKNYNKSRPAVQFALMLDAGSTGSRIHIYKFTYANNKLSPDLRDEIFEQVKPGLSSYPDDPKAAANSLNGLMDIALESVPSHLHKCTPVALKATAGLRLLGDKKSMLILNAVRKKLEDDYPFPVVDMNPIQGDGVSVMDGKEEGVYAWITVNYLTSKIGNPTKTPTAAIMDLGGGSTQIVFEPESPFEVPPDSDYKYELEFGNYKYILYQHSYLGYGLNEGRKKLKLAASEKTQYPCLKKGESVDFEHDGIKKILKGIGKSFEMCAKFVSSHLFSKTDSCQINPCSFDGIHQPNLDKSFPYNSKSGSGELFAFSYFYDKTFPFGLKEKFTVKEVKDLAEKLCSENPEAHFSSDLLLEEPLICSDLSFIHGLLSVGYELQPDRELKVLKKIEGFETGWCLGATIQMIDRLTKDNSDK